MARDNVPDDDHVMRMVPKNRLVANDDGNVTIMAQALELRDGEEGLSTTWIEYFDRPTDRALHAAVCATRATRMANGSTAYAIGNVGKIKEICAGHGNRVRILHAPIDLNKGHSEIRQFDPRLLVMLEELARDGLDRLIFNRDYPGDAPVTAPRTTPLP